MQEMLSTVCQQQSHVKSHWPTRLLLSRVRAHVSREQVRLNQLHPDGNIWGQRVRPSPADAGSDLQTLALPRLAGKATRPFGLPVATVTTDAFCFAVGARCQPQDSAGRPSRIERHKWALTSKKREPAHTVRRTSRWQQPGWPRSGGSTCGHRRMSIGLQDRVRRQGLGLGDRQAVVDVVDERTHEVLWTAREPRLLCRAFCLAKQLTDRTSCGLDGRKLSHDGQTWALELELFLRATKTLGISWSCRTAFDLAACRSTTKAKGFCSRCDQPESAGVDTHSCSAGTCVECAACACRKRWWLKGCSA